jgi:hypothetical protein
MHLERAPSSLISRIPRDNLGSGNIHSAHRCPINQRPRKLKRHVNRSQLVFDSLIGPNRPPELSSLLGVLDRPRKQRTPCAKKLRGTR